MRDLGTMGESTFKLWCAEAGLIANGSQIDKTGWDFFVEFPYNTSLDPTEIHKSAFECKVQVKSTDKNERKISITLSNLRRLITVQMPVFFVFIEFDGKNSAQNAFVVHVDNELISKVLRRMHELEQNQVKRNINKRTMTIIYDESQRLYNLNGASLRESFSNHIGGDIAEYIARKKAHLESTGFEDGFANLTFTLGKNNLQSLVDVSLGIEKQVEISHFTGIDTRFGIACKTPFVDIEGGKLEMPDVKPSAEGFVRFKETKLSVGLTFNARLYISPFNVMVPHELKKMRVEGDFFDLQFAYNGDAIYSFSFGKDLRLEVKHFRDAVKLVDLFSSSGKMFYGELVFEGFPKLEFKAGCKDSEFDYSKELKVLECAVKLISDFGVSEVIDISFDEISRHEAAICKLLSIIGSSPNWFKVEFNVSGELNPGKEVAFIFTAGAPIGSHIFGLLCVLIGTIEEIENKRFRLVTRDVIVERRFVARRGESISSENLALEMEEVERKYDSEYTVILYK